MKLFEVPEIEIAKFNVEDVITTSEDPIVPGDPNETPVVPR